MAGLATTLTSAGKVKGLEDTGAKEGAKINREEMIPTPRIASPLSHPKFLKSAHWLTQRTTGSGTPAPQSMSARTNTS